MTTSTRRRPSRAVIKALGAFFAGPRCVVSDLPPDKLRPERHHLDDDPSNSEFPNLIPLAHHHNDFLGKVALSAAHTKFVGDLGALDPTRLMSTARECFNIWHSGSAYGCSRLAFWVARRYQKQEFEHTVIFACNALYFCRHRNALDAKYELVLDILRRDLEPGVLASEALSAASALAILQEIAGIYGEHGHIDEGEALYKQIDRLLQQPNIMATEPRQHFALLRREASIRGIRGSIRDARAQLKEARGLVGADPNADASARNTEAWLLMDRGEYGEAVDVLEPLFLHYRDKLIADDGKTVLPGALTAWNAAELMLNYATALTRSRNGRLARRRLQALQYAKLLFELGGSRPFTIRQGVWTASPEIAAQIASPTLLPLGVDTILAPLAKAVCQRVGLL